MNEKEIELGREEYQYLKEENNKKLGTFKKLVLLETDNERVAEYSNLLRSIGKEPSFSDLLFSECDGAHDAFDFIATNTMDSNGIYVHICKSGYVKNSGTIFGQLYKDLETTREVFVREECVSEFENSHAVLKFDASDTMVAYDNLRKEFFRDLIFMSQERAVQKVFEKVNKSN